MSQIVGIDYGAQRAGTTRLCVRTGDSLRFFRSSKKESADSFVLDMIEQVKPSLVGIDAPLSLPRAYYGEGKDFHYRKCDRTLSAMSPMFLGGLTARAMSLAQKVTSDIIEVYPAARVRSIAELAAVYNKKDKTSLRSTIEALQTHLDLTLNDVQDYHDIDSVLAWWISDDYQKQKAQRAGNKKEGFIHY